MTTTARKQKAATKRKTDAMWKTFTDSNKADKATRDRIIETYAPMVQKIAGVLAAKAPSHVTADDFVSEGYMGLMQAVENFEPERGWKFETYASNRVRGAILDYVRRQDWAPRSLRSQQRELESAKATLAQQLCRQPTSKELADHLNMNSDEFSEFTKRIAQSHHISADQLNNQLATDGDGVSLLEVIADEGADDGFDAYVITEMRDSLAQGFMKLNERSRQIIILYHYDGLTLGEIGSIYGVSESRVSQVYNAALKKLRTVIPQEARQ